MRPNHIQLKLLTKGIEQKELARKLGFSPTAVANVLRFRSHSFEIQLRVAELLGEDPASVWGEHFAPVYRLRKQNHRSEQPASLPG